MVATLSTKATEQSTYVITVSFYDEDENAVTPTAASWTLTDENGNVINEREDVEIGALDTSVDVVLQGDDLAVAGIGSSARIFTVSGTYNSNAGSGLPFKAHVRFLVDRAYD